MVGSEDSTHPTFFRPSAPRTGMMSALIRASRFAGFSWHRGPCHGLTREGKLEVQRAQDHLLARLVSVTASGTMHSGRNQGDGHTFARPSPCSPTPSSCFALRSPGITLSWTTPDTCTNVAWHFFCPRMLLPHLKLLQKMPRQGAWRGTFAWPGRPQTRLGNGGDLAIVPRQSFQKTDRRGPWPRRD